MPTIPSKKLLVERRKVNEGLVQDIKDIKKMLVEMQTLEAARNEREITVKRDIDSLNLAVNGNGKPGLKTDVQILQNKINGVYWLGGVVIVASVGNIIAILFGR
jgi:hypothetical protein